MAAHAVNVGKMEFRNDAPLKVIAGPCAMESRDHAIEMASALSEITKNLGCDLIYKSSFDKANRTSNSSYRGIGMDKALEVFDEVKSRFNCPVITDVHEIGQCEKVAEVVDVLQIPAFLCRQTDLLAAAAKTGKPLNIKKGQFLAPWDMQQVVAKVESFGHNKIMLCERGASFGYNTLVSDMRSIPIMKSTGYPVIYDGTHSVQQPGGLGGTSGGQREFAPLLTRAAVSLGVAGIFLETHQDPDSAPSDGPNMIYLKDMPRVLSEILAFDQLAKQYPVELQKVA